MVLCIEIEKRTKEELDLLVAVGGFSGYSQAISLAISNQVVLTRQISEAGRELVIGENKNGAKQESDLPTRATNQSSTRTDALGLDDIFAQNHSSISTFKPAPLPSDVFVRGQDVPVDRWIFGQHNKLLPVKASCRALVRLCSESDGVLLSKAASEIASRAVSLGDFLNGIDKKYGFARDEALSVAFPRSISEIEHKARSRFANQFVANVNKHGQVSGLLVDLKLINLVSGRDKKIMLTEPGFTFATLSNPILDSSTADVVRGTKLSGEERDFLLNHIALNVPSEDFAYRTVIAALLEEANTPEKLDGYLEQFLQKRANKPFTKAFLTTQRSGVISRMADLGMLERNRDGIRVTYVLTSTATKYLETSQLPRTA